MGDDSWKRALKVITGGRGWEKAESQGPREAGPPFGEPGAGKFSGAGSLESRPRSPQEEGKTGKRALKAETGRRVGRRGRVKGVEKEGGQKRNRPAKWRAGRREILGPKPRLPTAGWSAPIRRRRYQGRDLSNPGPGRKKLEEGDESGKWAMTVESARRGRKRSRPKEEPARHLASREQENSQGRDLWNPALGSKKLEEGHESRNWAIQVESGAPG